VVVVVVPNFLRQNFKGRGLPKYLENAVALQIEIKIFKKKFFTMEFEYIPKYGTKVGPRIQTAGRP
jgi:hypothetical protein